MRMRYFLVIVLLTLGIFFASSFFLSEQSVDVAGCKASWKTFSVATGRSDLCSSDSCVASPADQQHNVLVDATLCACERASASQFVDSGVNKRIEETVKLYFGFDLPANQVCGSQGQQFLVKRSYD